MDNKSNDAKAISKNMPRLEGIISSLGDQISRAQAGAEETAGIITKFGGSYPRDDKEDSKDNEPSNLESLELLIDQLRETNNLSQANISRLNELI